MNDSDKILKGYYNKLVEFEGKEKTDTYFRNGSPNYAVLSLRILYLSLKERFKKNPGKFILILSAIIAVSIIYILDLFLIL